MVPRLRLCGVRGMRRWPHMIGILPLSPNLNTSTSPQSKKYTPSQPRISSVSQNQPSIHPPSNHQTTPRPSQRRTQTKKNKTLTWIINTLALVPPTPPTAPTVPTTPPGPTTSSHTLKAMPVLATRSKQLSPRQTSSRTSPCVLPRTRIRFSFPVCCPCAFDNPPLPLALGGEPPAVAEGGG